MASGKNWQLQLFQGGFSQILRLLNSEVEQNMLREQKNNCSKHCGSPVQKLSEV